MLSAVTITGLRCLESLTVHNLSRVNLITGRNSVGKTTLLEALRLYADAGAWSTLEAILQERGEVRPGRALVDAAVEYLRGAGTSPGATPRGSASILVPGRPILSLQVGWEVRTAEGGFKVAPLDEPSGTTLLFQSVIGSDLVLRGMLGTNVFAGGLTPAPTTRCASLPLRGRTDAEMEQIWARVEFTREHDDVIRLLRIIDQDVERVAFRVTENGERRFPAIKLKGRDGAIPLPSMGEGASRVFGLVLTAVAARGGLLLVDEIDTGLHWSVMTQIWTAIFELAEQLDVQVFATTHSHDCVQSLARVARARVASGKPLDAEVIRLARFEGRVHAHVFADPDEFAFIDENDLEVR